METRFDYQDSGLSTVEAVADARGKWLTDARRLGLPGPLARLLSRLAVISMTCDGGCRRVGRTTGQLTDSGVWSASGGWLHRADLDFCPACQVDGRMQRALADGVRPRGAH